MRLGVDFDNTIVCYDHVFHRVAVEEGVIPASGVGTTKNAVRDWLRAEGRENDWTLLQGLVYGVRIDAASPFPGVEAFFRSCTAAGVEICIISHKTRYPFRGPPHDLHAAAQAWLERRGFFDPAGIALPPSRTFFELTKADKLARILAEGCTHFIDDLPELLADPGFPADVERILFDPHDIAAPSPKDRVVRHWNQMETVASMPSGKLC